MSDDRVIGPSPQIEPTPQIATSAPAVPWLLRNPLFFAVLSVLVGVLVGAVVLAVAGYNPILAYGEILAGVFSSPRNVAAAIVRSTPIIITGLSVTFAFKTGLFNIGAEGQFIIGSLVAALVGFSVNLPAVLHVPLLFVTAFVAGAAWGGIAAASLRGPCYVERRGPHQPPPIPEPQPLAPPPVVVGPSGEPEPERPVPIRQWTAGGTSSKVGWIVAGSAVVAGLIYLGTRQR